jgi:hypothetical protein
MTPAQRRPFILVAVVLLALGGYGLWWRTQAAAFQAAVNAYLGNACAPVQIVHDGPVQFGGFPYRLEARFANARVTTRPQLGVVARLSSPKLALEAQPWRKGFFLLMTDKATLTVTGPGFDADGTSMSAAGSYAQASLRLDGGRIERLSVMLMQPKAQTSLFNTGAFTAKDIQLHLREAQARKAEGASAAPLAELFLRGTQFTRGGTAPVNLVVDTQLTGPLPPMCGSLGLEAWRTGAGALKLRSIEATSADMTAKGDATLALGANGEIQLAGTLTTDRPIWLEQLLRGEPLSPRTGRPAPQKVPVTIQGGELRIGQSPPHTIQALGSAGQP